MKDSLEIQQKCIKILLDQVAKLKPRLSYLLFLVKSSPPQVYLEKGALKICSKFTGDHPCQSVISIKLQSQAGVFSRLAIFASYLI